MTMTRLCYLCGKDVSPTEKISFDHVPMRQLYSPEIRKKHSPNLLTLPAHVACNTSYQSDEDYFVTSFAGLTETDSGKHAWAQAQKALIRSAGFRKRLLSEFSKESPDGKQGPPGSTCKTFDRDRVKNVIWKITRGLFFKEYGRYLPVETQGGIQVASPWEEPPKEFGILRGMTSRGSYPEVFDYKIKEYKLMGQFQCYTFGYLFWESFLFLCHFRDPNCDFTKFDQENENLRVINS